jgi:hypothetical protein
LQQKDTRTWRDTRTRRGKKKSALDASANMSALTEGVMKVRMPASRGKVSSAPMSQLGARTHVLVPEAELQTQGPTDASTSSSVGIQAVKKSRKQHRKDWKKLICAAEAQKAFAENTDAPRAEALKTHLGSTQNTTASIDTDALPANWSGYEATFKGAMGDEVLNYDKLIAEGYELVEWDGVQVTPFAPAFLAS